MQMNSAVVSVSRTASEEIRQTYGAHKCASATPEVTTAYTSAMYSDVYSRTPHTL